VHNIQRSDGRIGFRLGQTARGKSRQNFGKIDRADRRPDQVLGIEFAELLFLQQRKND
jgi:hypothetical protein